VFAGDRADNGSDVEEMNELKRIKKRISNNEQGMSNNEVKNKNVFPWLLVVPCSLSDIQVAKTNNQYPTRNVEQ